MICLLWYSSKPKLSNHYLLLLLPNYLSSIVLNLGGWIIPRRLMHLHRRLRIVLRWIRHIMAGSIGPNLIVCLNLDSPVRILFTKSINDFLCLSLIAGKCNKAITKFVELSLRIRLLDAAYKKGVHQIRNRAMPFKNFLQKILCSGYW